MIPFTLKQKIDCMDCLYFSRKDRRCILGEENCILLTVTRTKDHGRYAWDKPKECRYCYWWDKKTWRCTREVLGGCAYDLLPSLLPEREKVVPVNPCRNCPYSRDHSGEPCVGICTKKILKAWEDARREVREELENGTYSGPPVRIRILVKGGSG